jgi:hypothetical protein
MLEALLGNKNKERILIFIKARNEGYAREIASFYKTDLTPIQNQLNKLEIGNILVSRNVGKTKLFMLNLQNPFFKEIDNLLSKIIEFLPEIERNELLIYRKRPRRSGKPL